MIRYVYYNPLKCPLQEASNGLCRSESSEPTLLTFHQHLSCMLPQFGKTEMQIYKKFSK